MPKRLNRWRVLAGGLFLSGVLGCEPTPPPTEDLGQIIYDPREVPGANRKYAMPERIERKKASGRDSKQDEPATPADSKPLSSGDAPTE